MTIDLDRLKELADKRGQVGLKFDEAIELIKAMPELVAEVERLRDQVENLKGLAKAMAICSPIKADDFNAELEKGGF